MKLNILCDAHWDSRLDKVSRELSATGYRRLFEEHCYGEGVLAIIIILVCREPDLNLRQRIRFVKKERTLYMDILLNLGQIREIEDDAARKRLVLERIRHDVPRVLCKYAISEFDESRFVDDLEKWIESV